MSRRDEKDSSRPSNQPHPPELPGTGTHPNAFSAIFLQRLRERDPHPATPEADFAGPWRVTRLWGDGTPSHPVGWAVFGDGERAPRLTFQEPDLAYLAAAALAVTERPERFRLQKSADDGGQARTHLLHDGYPAATVAGASIAPGCNLPDDLTRLADLRVRPRALMHFLLSVPDEVLERAGVLLMDELRDGRG